MHKQVAEENAGNQSIWVRNLKSFPVDPQSCEECFLVAHLFDLFLFNKHLLNIYRVLELFIQNK